MSFKNILLLTTIPFILAACGGAGAGMPYAAAAISGLNLPQNIEVLQDDSAFSGNPVIV